MHRKFSYLLIFIMMGLFLTGPFSFAQMGAPIDLKAQQEQAEAEAKADAEAKAQVQAQGEVGAQQDIQEEHDTQKLDKVLKDYNKDKNKVKKDAETIRQMDIQEGLPEDQMGDGTVVDPDKPNQPKIEFKGLNGILPGRKKIEPKKLNKIKYSEAVKTALEPLQKMSEPELIKLLKENSKQSEMGQYLEKFPSTLLFSVRLIKDPDALPKFVSIADDQDKLIRFGGIMMATILIGFVLKRLFRKEGRSIPAAVGFWFLRFLIINSLRFGILMYFYGNEVRPVFSIAGKTFF